MSDLNSQSLEKFIAGQLEVWDTARNNFEALKGVKVKSFAIGKSTVKVQFNPARIVSSAAKVDTKSLKERKCFLCTANRPAVQEGIAWGEYTVLINPFPIFPRHLTIPCNGHVDQRINGRLGDMMQLAKALEGYTLFYNGPKCGASAPDHMHFQAGNRGFMPMEDDIKKADKTVVRTADDAELSLLCGLSHPCFMIETKDNGAAPKTDLFEAVYGALTIPDGEPEPMLNILCWYDADTWRVLVFPRKKHRPTCYFAEGDDNILLSPASVDMGGVFITPLEKDFDKISADDIRTILEECCLSETEIKEIAKTLKF